ncbi:MAG: ribbon-helix-helix domain-containing protein [Candidatus Bathyarchaeia archaeon]|nr:hypothetical protein [Candidatus Bathyarchaeota archaeon]
MKTLRISDDVHQKLTALLGELVAQTSKMQTYQDAIEAMLNQSVILPPELLNEVENFISRNRHLGYTTKEEFIRDAVRWRLRTLSGEYETIEIPKSEFDELKDALKEMNAPYLSVTDFIYSQIRQVLEEYRKYRRERRAR